jgi:spermidine synthase
MVNNSDNQAGTISYGQHYLLAVAFFSGMAVMGVEISASRLMAPFFGTSLSIWSAIIGSVMIALTLGYYLGGILADKHPRMSFLATWLFFASLFMIFLPYLAQPVMETTLGRFTAAHSSYGGGQGSYAIVTALVVCALMISAPVVVLGMTSPFIIRLDSLRSTEVGRISGKVFAFSTLGSILGTFLPALFLIPVIGTRFSFLLFGGMLLCITLPSIERGKSFLYALAVLGLVVALLLGIQGWGTSLGKYLVKEKETNYQYVRIYRLPVPSKTSEEPKMATVLLTDAGLGLQSMWVEGQPYTDSWQDFFAIVPRIYDVCNHGSPPNRLLLLGLGGACAPYLISQFYPDITIDGVEIDPLLIDAAKPYFPFSAVKNLNVHIGDGRFFLKSARMKYDAIVVDAFRPPFIPFHLATTEFFDQVKEHLAEDGIMVMNVGSSGKMLVFKGIANTVASVFPHVYFAQYYSPEDRSIIFSSRFIVASSKDLNLDNSDVEKRLFSVPDPQWRKIFETMRDRSGFESSQDTYFRKILFDPEKQYFRDDLSSLEVLSEREFLGLVTGLSK